MRVFVAIAMPDATRDALEDLQGDLPVGRAMTRDTLHLTLAFLGEQSDATLEELHGALCTVRAPGLDLRLSGLGTFGSRSPTVLWAGLEPDPALNALHTRVRNAVRRSGIELSRERFRPHVTLARFRRRLHPDELLQIRWFLERHGGFSAAPFRADRFTLFESVLHGGGADHRPLAHYPLDSADTHP